MSAIIANYDARFQNGHAFLRIDSNTTITTANLCVANTTIANEQCQSFVINRILWSTANNLTIARGANNLLTLYGNGDWDLANRRAFPLNEYPSANLVVTIGTPGGSALIEVVKTSL